MGWVGGEVYKEHSIIIDFAFAGRIENYIDRQVEMGKLASQVRVRWNEDVFHLFLYPNLLSNVAPQIVTSVDLLSGQWATPGSIVYWNCNIGGGNLGVKEVIEAVDKEKKSITYKVIEGDIMQLYNVFKISVDVEKMNEEDNYLVKWSVEYEKKSEAVPDPTSIIDAGIAITNLIEKYTILPN